MEDEEYLWPGGWNVEDRDRVVPTAPWNLIREAERVGLADISRICRSTRFSSLSFFFPLFARLVRFIRPHPAAPLKKALVKLLLRHQKYRVLRVWTFCTGSSKRCESRGVSMSLTSAHCIMVDDEDSIYFFSASFLFYLDIPMIVAKTCFTIYILVMRVHVLRGGAKRGDPHVKMMGIFSVRLMDVILIWYYKISM